MLFQYLAHEK